MGCVFGCYYECVGAALWRLLHGSDSVLCLQCVVTPAGFDNSAAELGSGYGANGDVLLFTSAHACQQAEGMTLLMFCDILTVVSDVSCFFKCSFKCAT
jgi:hypothetical protein